MGQGELALEFVHAGTDGGAVDGLVRAYERLLRDFGISYYCIGNIYSSKRNYLRGNLWSASSHPWIRHWQERQYMRVDPLIWYVRQYPSFIRWSHLRARANPPGCEMFDEAGEYGLRDGIAFGVPLGREQIAALGLGMEADKVEACEQVPLHLASVYFATRMAQLHEAPPLETKPLTEREKECLRWVAIGRRDTEIACILRISEATARQHVTSASRKLRARTRAQAVALALSTSQIRL